MNLDFKDLNVLLVGDFMVDQYIFVLQQECPPKPQYQF